MALIGIYVGVIPVALGLLWYPLLRRLGRTKMNFILALTVGLLLFLVVDMFQEAQEVAADAPVSFDTPVLVPLAGGAGGGIADCYQPLAAAGGASTIAISLVAV